MTFSGSSYTIAVIPAIPVADPGGGGCPEVGTPSPFFREFGYEKLK
jgi:hypothetical protein